MKYLKDTQELPHRRRTARGIKSATLPSRPVSDDSPLARRLKLKREMEMARLAERDEDGTIIYDGSDDYDPGEDEGCRYENASDGFRLKTNEEIFTEEYMLDFAEKMDAKIVRFKRNQRIISACVIVSIILYIILLIYLIW